MDTFKIQSLIESLSMFDKLFDTIRVIEPESMTIIMDHEENNQKGESTCYDFWDKQGRCSNCISLRAKAEDDTFIKIEVKGDKMFMVTASPVKVGAESYIFEMIKDITHTQIITEIDGRDIKESDKMITYLNNQVITDDLTCLYNRRYINAQLPQEIIMATQNNQQFSLLMIDIDNFKEINDTYGHLAGDTVIQTISEAMGNKVRKDIDWIARYGGEEFLIFLKGADQNAAHRVAEKIRITTEKRL